MKMTRMLVGAAMAAALMLGGAFAATAETNIAPNDPMHLDLFNVGGDLLAPMATPADFDYGDPGLMLEVAYFGDIKGGTLCPAEPGVTYTENLDPIADQPFTAPGVAGFGGEDVCFLS
jgi:hypothetical protein